MEGIRKAINKRNLQEGQWEDRKQWNLGVGRGRTFWNRLIYINIQHAAQVHSTLCTFWKHAYSYLTSSIHTYIQSLEKGICYLQILLCDQINYRTNRGHSYCGKTAFLHPGTEP
jgi:hypothetical protein